jgi:predicted Zn-dependent protease with MMP-like domain
MRTFEFEDLVREAIESIPYFFLNIMTNVDFHVHKWPLRRHIEDAGLEQGDTLLGLYEGFPVTDGFDGNMAPPNIITIFQGPIEKMCTSDDEVKEQIQKTIVHEVAHFFGISDAQLDEWGLY